MRKKIFLGILAVLVLFVVFSKWWPMYKYPAVQGKVTDATTGKPIENAIVVCGYTETVAGIVDNVTQGIGSEVSVTNKDGEYSIPLKRVWHILPWWLPLGGVWEYRMNLTFAHPFYETKNLLNTQGLSWSESHSNKESTYRENKGKINLDMKLMSLEDKYVKNRDSKTRKELASSFISHCGSYDNGSYWVVLKKKNVLFNLENIFKEWDKIANKVFIGEYNYFNKIYYPDCKNKITRALGEGK